MQKLLQIGIKGPLQLALMVPSSYKDYRIKSSIDAQEVLLDVTILSVQKLAKITKITAFSHNINKEVELIFFKFTPFHQNIFTTGKRLFVAGRVQWQYGKVHLLQPKNIANYKVGKIFPSYKVPIRGDIFEKIKEQYLSKETLREEGLPEDVSAALYTIHFPDEAFYKEYKKNGGFFGKYLEALKYTEAYVYLKGLKQKRVSRKAMCSIQESIEPFYKGLPFTPTVDQKRAIADIQKDLQKNIAARRVIVGDVGSGKSLVMFATAFLARKKRAILMAPTTILAHQLFDEAKRLLPKDMNIALVTSDTKEEDLNGYNFLIGTHALLYRRLPSACVVMVDEQHRFGTEQRNKLKKLIESRGASPHFFQFSATPIPRTQALMQSALVDFSLIQQVPFKKDITTKVISKEDFKELLRHITQEIAAKHQVLIVYPLVEESEHYEYKSLEEAKAFWQKYFDNVYITHGKDAQKDAIVQEFREKGDILLATTVIEVGISLPRLTTIVIVGAENMGLATLHQLRGRVSRMGLKGYCFLYTKDTNNKRLQEFSKLSSGFDIAELDLKYRKSGDILEGKEQSGKSFRFLNMAEDEEIIKRVKTLLD